MSHIALGVSNLASGVSNLAEGMSNLASWVSNLASGVSNLASGVSHIALGVSNLAEGMSGRSRLTPVYSPVVKVQRSIIPDYLQFSKLDMAKEKYKEETDIIKKCQRW